MLFSYERNAMTANQIQAGWSTFKRAGLRVGLAFLALIAAPVLSIFAFHSSAIVFVITVLCVGVLARELLKLGTLNCPNCQNSFFYKGYYGNILSCYCKHCGARIGSALGKNDSTIQHIKDSDCK
jgi:hypothetical protein